MVQRQMTFKEVYPSSSESCMSARKRQLFEAICAWIQCGRPARVWKAMRDAWLNDGASLQIRVAEATSFNYPGSFNSKMFTQLYVHALVGAVIRIVCVDDRTSTLIVNSDFDVEEFTENQA